MRSRRLIIKWDDPQRRVDMTKEYGGLNPPGGWRREGVVCNFEVAGVASHGYQGSKEHREENMRLLGLVDQYRA